MFIIKYKLKKDFFDNDLNYPVVIGEVKKKDTTKIKKIVGSWPTRLVSLFGLVGFVTMTVFGVKNMRYSTLNVPSFFSSEVKSMREEVKNKKTSEGRGGSDFKNLVADDYYLYQEKYTFEDKTTADVGIGFFKLDENLNHTFYQAGYELGETLIFKTKVSVAFESRCFSGTERIKFKTYHDGDEVLTISADYKNDKFKYNLVSSYYFGEGDNYTVSKNSTAYHLICSYFEEQVKYYRTCLKELFNKSKLDVKDPNDQSKRISYEKYNSILLNDTKRYESYSNQASALILCGLIFSCIFLALFIASAFIQTRIVETLSKEHKEENVILENKPIEHETRALRPNLEIRPFIPESVLKIVGVIILFYSSIGLYYFVNSVLSFDIIGSIDIYNRLSLFKSLSSIAIIFIFFTKMDVVINKKNVFLSNYVMFFAGLIYYFLLMITNYSLSLSQTVYADIGKTLLTVLPGNFIWGILAFNLLAQLLFTVPDYIKGNKKREVSYHALTVLPILYLLASALFTIGEKSFNWSTPLWFKTLFFTKSVPIILFAIIYCLSMFVYKRLVVYAFGEKKAEIIRNGSRYYFIKNIIAALIIVLIGVIELSVHFATKDGKAFGFGENYLLICAAPFIIFYHPHRGPRNSLWDLIFMVLNGIAMMSGILLLGSSFINYLILI